MTEAQQRISPIAIDLGVIHTGVFFAHYKPGTSIKSLSQRSGEVYRMDKDKLTVMMAERTARRHQRRAVKRNKMVKRLFRLIWESHFKLPWNENIQQAASYLLNRRGFSFLTEEYEPEVLAELPDEVYELLPEPLRGDDAERDFSAKLQGWARDGEETVERMLNALLREPKHIKRRKVYIEHTKKLAKLCRLRQQKKNIVEGHNERDKFSRLSRWILEEWRQAGVKGITVDLSDKQYNVDMVAVLNSTTPRQAGVILRSLPVLTNEEQRQKTSVWRFSASEFSFEDAEFVRPDEDAGARRSGRGKRQGGSPLVEWKKTHLRHLAFALQRTLDDLRSGSRHRMHYFDEIREELAGNGATHRALDEFGAELRNGAYAPLNQDTLFRLLANLSNLEFSLLRKYFTDIEFKKSDRWDERQLSQLFGKWITREWRVDAAKDKDKAEGAAGDYGRLLESWARHCKAHKATKQQGARVMGAAVVDFLMKTAPVMTIPPFQNNNNRQPPKCQSMILNTTLLDRQYPGWEGWLRQLSELPQVREYLGDYEASMARLESGKGKPYFQEAQGTGKRSVAGKTKWNRRTLKHLKARQLQFLLDRVKIRDVLRLNEVYSHAKKFRQRQSTDTERDAALVQLEATLADSVLPAALKSKRHQDDQGLFKQGEFLHLVCRYFALRQRVKDGRLFIHPMYKLIQGVGYMDTGRYNDAGLLVTYCNHKPRQKRHQMAFDIAALLQVPVNELEKVVTAYSEERSAAVSLCAMEDKLDAWLSGFDGLKTNCAQAADAQKQRGGRLKHDIDKVYSQVQAQGLAGVSPRAKRVRDGLEKTGVHDAARLYGLCARAADLWTQLVEVCAPKVRRQHTNSLINNPAAAVFALAQINNIVFKERNGFASSCVVCSADNGLRMQRDTGSGDAEYTRAQRLPAISTRVIDGVVRKQTDAVARRITAHKWGVIERDLKAGRHVHVPIIMESNRFRFDSGLKVLKGGRPEPDNEEASRNGAGDVDEYVTKVNRVKSAANGICPFTGEEITGKGVVAHIIQSSDGWGIIDDETNLIWATEASVNKHEDKQVSLQDLSDQYLNVMFGTADINAIEEWIVLQLQDESDDKFSFGQYRNFQMLPADVQTAFRHALFLVGHPLRRKVINAIFGFNKMFVNGTQRYFAQVLANMLYKKALEEDRRKQGHRKKQGLKGSERSMHELLSFDYMGIASHEEYGVGRHGQNVYDLRESLFKVHRQDLCPESNGKNEDNEYLSLIDAQLAFCIACNAHQAEGGLRVNMGRMGLWSASSRGAPLFNAVQVPVKPATVVERQIPKPTQQVAANRPLFRDNPVAMRFMQLIEITTPGNAGAEDRVRYLRGFAHDGGLKANILHDDEYRYGKVLTAEEAARLKPLYTERFAARKWADAPPPLLFDRYGPDEVSVRVYELDKTGVYEFLVTYFNTALNVDDWGLDRLDILAGLYDVLYYTQRKNVIVQEGNKEALYRPKEQDYICNRIINPELERVWGEFQKFMDAEQKGGADAGMRERVREYFSKPKDGMNGAGTKAHNARAAHERSARVCSLPVSSGKGMLIRKRDWQGKTVYVCKPASKDFSLTILHTDLGVDGGGRRSGADERLVNTYRQENIFYPARDVGQMKKLLKQIDPARAIDPNLYYEATVPEKFRPHILRAENRRTDAARPRFRFYLNTDNRMDFTIFKAFIDDYPFRHMEAIKKSVKEEWLGSGGRIYDPESLSECIAALADKQLEVTSDKMLPALREMQRLYQAAQSDSVLEFMAKGKFTLTDRDYQAA